MNKIIKNLMINLCYTLMNFKYNKMYNNIIMLFMINSHVFCRYSVI